MQKAESISGPHQGQEMIHILAQIFEGQAGPLLTQSCCLKMLSVISSKDVLPLVFFFAFLLLFWCLLGGTCGPLVDPTIYIYMLPGA